MCSYVFVRECSAICMDNQQYGDGFCLQKTCSEVQFCECKVLVLSLSGRRPLNIMAERLKITATIFSFWSFLMTVIMFLYGERDVTVRLYGRNILEL